MSEVKMSPGRTQTGTKPTDARWFREKKFYPLKKRTQIRIRAAHACRLNQTLVKEYKAQPCIKQMYVSSHLGVEI